MILQLKDKYIEYFRKFLDKYRKFGKKLKGMTLMISEICITQLF